MEETASGFAERATRSEMRREQVLLEGTHCVQQQSGRIPQRATHSPLFGIVIDMIRDPSKKSNDWFQYLLKLRAFSVFAGKVVIIKANAKENAKLPNIMWILTNNDILSYKLIIRSDREQNSSCL